MPAACTASAPASAASASAALAALLTTRAGAWGTLLAAFFTTRIAGLGQTLRLFAGTSSATFSLPRALRLVAGLASRWADLGLPPPPSRELTFGTTFRACAVCLEEYSVGDRLRVLDNCGHCFHRACLDRWVAASRKPACPVCAAPAPALARSASGGSVRGGHARRPVGAVGAARVPRAAVQLIDLSVHDSWVDWLGQLARGQVPEESPPLSLALPAD